MMFPALRINSRNCRSHSMAMHVVRRSLTQSHRRAVTRVFVAHKPVGHRSNVLRSQCLTSRPLSQPLLHCRAYHGSTYTMDEYPPHVLFPMPALSPTMELGTITSWALKEGDSFSAGDVLCSIETDKASVDFEAQDDGILAKILREGSNAVDLKIGTPICVIAEEAEDVPAFANFTLPADSASSEAATPPPAVGVTAGESTPPSPVAPAADSPLGAFVLMPSARHLAESKGLDATVLAPGSGKDGRVTKGDVLQAISKNTLPPLMTASDQTLSSSNDAAPTPTAASSGVGTTPAVAPVSLGDLIVPEIMTDGPTEDVPNSKMRKIIAQRLTASKKEVPHFYTSFNVALDNVLRLRKSLAKDHEIKISVNDFVIRCCALALRDVPEVNGTLSSDGLLQTSDSVDISVAVATPTGLITPILFDANQKGLAEIADTIKDLATRARDGKLAPHEYQGGTFSVSNLGMFGISEFSAVINPPQAAILAVGGGTRTFVPTPYKEDGEGNQSPSIATLLTARLSADRRVVDEATAALFGQSFTHYMNQPQLLLL